MLGFVLRFFAFVFLLSVLVRVDKQESIGGRNGSSSLLVARLAKEDIQRSLIFERKDGPRRIGRIKVHVVIKGPNLDCGILGLSRENEERTQKERQQEEPQVRHLSPFGNRLSRATRPRPNLYRLDSWELYSQQRHSPPPGSERQLECSRAASERLQGAAPLGCHSS